ncbi:nucleoporin-like protein [Aureococcus anophagefferens]|uniref:Nucleoporin-like protein n=1 Tax=Aureococcus anophagefferens TaxID=44056 RepID=A0ABR1GAQ8_AURAN
MMTPWWRWAAAPTTGRRARCGRSTAAATSRRSRCPTGRGDDGGSQRPREYAAAFARLPELASQHVVGERRLVCLTRLGVEELAKVRPWTRARNCCGRTAATARRFGSPADDKRSGGGDAALRAFAESYGRAEACAMALAIACGADARGGGQVDEPLTARAARARRWTSAAGRASSTATTTSASTATQTAPVPALNGGARAPRRPRRAREARTAPLGGGARAPPPGAPAGSLLGLLGGPAKAAPKRPATAVDARLKQLGGHCYLYFNGGDALAHGASLHLAKAARLTEGLRHAEAEDARARRAGVPRRAGPGGPRATCCPRRRPARRRRRWPRPATPCASTAAPPRPSRSPSRREEPRQRPAPGDAGDAELAGDHWELALYRGRPPDGAQRRDEDAREACHDVALDALKRELWRCGAQPAATRAGEGAATAPTGLCWPAAARSAGPSSTGASRRPRPRTTGGWSSCRSAPPRSTSAPADPGLLWRHHLAHGEDARAAALMEDLATAPGGDLDARVSCLVRAAESARARARGGAAARRVCGHDDEPLAVKLWTSLLRRLVPRRARDAAPRRASATRASGARRQRRRRRAVTGDDGAASGAFFEDRTWLRPLCDAVASLGRELADDDGELGDAGAADDAPWASGVPAPALVALLQRLATLLYETTRAGAADGARPAAPTWPKDALRAAGRRLALFLALLQVGAARDASDLEKLHALANAADVLDAWATAAANDVRERRAFASGLRHGADPEHLIATLRGFEHTADPLLDKTLNLLHNTRDRVDAIFSR